MRRLIAITLVLIAVPLVLVFGVAAKDGGGSGYKVRAIFDFVRAVPGEDVKVAGAKVGSIESLHVTPDNKAAVVLRIDDAGFTPFHANAHCTIRPQSLIGETFAECSPGSSAAPVLPAIKQGDGKGEHLLPLSHTSSPVDIDEINDIMREPTRERLALIIDEFGTALAGRGQDLNQAIHRANPALRDTDKVLAGDWNLEPADRSLDRLDSALRRRVEADPESVERGLAQLVLTLVELLRQLLERQALRRIEGGSLSDDEVERLGETFMLLERRMEELREAFGLEQEDLNLDLGPLGRLM